MPMIHPQFNPIALQLGPVGIHWYGLMYILAFVLFVVVCRVQIKRGYASARGYSNDDVEDLLFWGACGVILGGRLGYVLFYKLSDYLSEPHKIFYVWEGGMSFHGGFLGVVIALCLWAWRKNKSTLQLADFAAPAIPLGLAVGRLGNFINGELWGRPTDPTAWWAMVFPQAQDGGIARHPSQLYQMGLEGLSLFVLTWLFAQHLRQDASKRGAILGVFVAGYGICRFIAEFAREPDAHLGLLGMGLSMGQWLSVPMVAVGLGFVLRAYVKK
jgi:phosphatidylglycerol---prolipoprotein diacylglyceryl transferase